MTGPPAMRGPKPPRGSLRTAIQQVLARAAEAASEVQGVGCLLLDGEGALRYVSATDRDGAILEVAEELSLEGPCHRTFVRGDTVVPDVLADERWERLTALIDDTPIRTVIGVPVLLDGRPIGALDAYAHEQLDWAERELAQLRLVAIDVAELIRCALEGGADARGDELTAQLRAAVETRETFMAAVDVISGTDGMSRATSALRIRQIGAVTEMSPVAVAREIIERGRLPELGEVSQLRESERHHREEMTRLALTDPLTGLANRLRLLDHLERAIDRARRSGRTPVLLFVDLDRFKVINDTMGHAAGDQVLTAVGRRLVDAVRGSDTVARLGGDEFAVLCEPDDDAIDVEGVTGRIVEALADPIAIVVPTEDGELVERQLFVQASVGVAVPDPDMRPNDLLRDADFAMYAAKRSAGNVTVSSTPLREAGARAIRLVHALRDALDGPLPAGSAQLPPGMALAYQPVVELRGGGVTAVEALVRWDHPELGPVPALEVVSLAEDVGLIVPLGAAILERACADARAWQDATADRGGPVVAVNVSTHQLIHPTFADVVHRAAEVGGLPLDRLCLELTESEALQSDSSAFATLGRLRDDGVHLTVDDFGTGYSSLSYLTRLPVQQLKIDRSFVAGVHVDPRDRAVAAAIVGLGETLDLRVVAEGVESPEQASVLTGMGCDLAQGYLYCRPVPVDDVPGVLARRGVAAHPSP